MAGGCAGLAAGVAVAGRRLRFRRRGPQAAALARQPYKAAPAADARMEALSYDEYRDIRFRPERALWRNSGSLFTVQFFPARARLHPGLAPVRSGQTARCARCRCRPRTSGRPRGAVMGKTVPPVDGAAGWRMSFPLNDAGRPDEAHRLSRCELLPRLGRAAALWPVGARLGGGHCRRQGRGVSRLHHLLARAPGPRRTRDALLCAARQPARGRRLSLRGAARHRHGARRAGPAVPARSRWPRSASRR